MTLEILVGCVFILGGVLAYFGGRRIAPTVNQLRVQQLQRSVLSAKAVEEQTEMYRRPEQVALTMWLLRIFGCVMTLAGVVALTKGVAG